MRAADRRAVASVYSALAVLAAYGHVNAVTAVESYGSDDAPWYRLVVARKDVALVAAFAVREVWHDGAPLWNTPGGASPYYLQTPDNPREGSPPAAVYTLASPETP